MHYTYPSLHRTALLPRANTSANRQASHTITVDGDPNTAFAHTAYTHIVFSTSLSKIPRSAYTSAARETTPMLAEGAVLEMSQRRPQHLVQTLYI
jgi:hypothetical protein